MRVLSAEAVSRSRRDPGERSHPCRNNTVPICPEFSSSSQKQPILASRSSRSKSKRPSLSYISCVKMKGAVKVRVFSPSSCMTFVRASTSKRRFAWIWSSPSHDTGPAMYAISKPSVRSSAKVACVCSRTSSRVWQGARFSSRSSLMPSLYQVPSDRASI